MHMHHPLSHAIYIMQKLKCTWTVDGLTSEFLGKDLACLDSQGYMNDACMDFYTG
jgi:hypothetical protein